MCRNSINYYMQQALNEAYKAKLIREIPVGAVIVKDGKIISRGHNKCESQNNATMHAEIIAISKACKKLGNWRLCGCDLYTTLEPCPMCAGAIIQSRIKKLYFGAFDVNAGSCGTLINLLDEKLFRQKITVYSGIMEDDCTSILHSFFADLRNNDS
jgi:tRNA(adenine34) deaminase